METHSKHKLLLRMATWMTCDSTELATVFQSYQDDGNAINKGYKLCGTLFTIGKISASSGLETGSARSVGLHLTY